MDHSFSKDLWVKIIHILKSIWEALPFNVSIVYPFITKNGKWELFIDQLAKMLDTLKFAVISHREVTTIRRKEKRKGRNMKYTLMIILAFLISNLIIKDSPSQIAASIIPKSCACLKASCCNHLALQLHLGPPLSLSQLLMREREGLTGLNNITHMAWRNTFVRHDNNGFSFFLCGDSNSNLLIGRETSCQ